MRKSNKYYPLLLALFFLILFFIPKSFASEAANFLSLKNNKVNLRQGPSFEYPIKLIYKKKYLPVKVLDKSETWRKVRDLENNVGWIHIYQLSKKKEAIVIEDELIVFNNPTIYSKPRVVLNKGRLCLIAKCENEWCKVKVDKYKGWVKKDSLWGRL